MLLAAATPLARCAEPPGNLVKSIKVLPDKAPDCSSLKSMVESVTRACATNDDRAVAIFNFLRLSHFYMCAPLAPDQNLPALKETTCYGWGSLQPMQAALARQLGWDWRFVEWGPHIIAPNDPPAPGGQLTVEVKYDERWHYLDVPGEFYAWMPDGHGGRTIAAEDDLAQNPRSLITDAFLYDRGRNLFYARDAAFIANGNKPEWFAAEIRPTGDSAWKRYTLMLPMSAGVQARQPPAKADRLKGIDITADDYSTDVNLGVGLSLTNTWDRGLYPEHAASPGAKYPLPLPAGGYWSGNHKDTRNSPGYGLVVEPYLKSSAERTYAIGHLVFAPDLSNDAFLGSLVSRDNVEYADKTLRPAQAGKPASVVLHLASPYIIATIDGQVPGSDSVECSTDDGKTFIPAALGSPAMSDLVKGKTAALLKIIFSHPITSLQIDATVQNNPWVLPYLSPGKNMVRVSVEDPKALGNNQLVVTYAYRLGSRSKSLERIYLEGKQIANQTDATWSPTLNYARKSFKASDLPATFEIDCPTPTGKHPVYPRMVFVRREVLAPGSAPSPLPSDAVEDGAAPPEQLTTLHNPFLIGTLNSGVTASLERHVVRTLHLPLDYLQSANAKGEVGNDRKLTWPVDQADDARVVANAVFFTGNLKDVPRDYIIAARLCVPLGRPDPLLAGKLGVVVLKDRVEKGKPMDVKSLTGIQDSALVPKQDDLTPATNAHKLLLLNVTEAIADAAGKATFNGLALRTVPERSKKGDFTGSCEISATEDAYLEIDILTDEPVKPATR